MILGGVLSVAMGILRVAVYKKGGVYEYSCSFLV